MKALILFSSIFAFTLTATAAPWQAPEGRQFNPPAFCPMPGEDTLLYPVCNDQVEKLDSTIQTAKASGKLMVITFGATWCYYTKKWHAFMGSDGMQAEIAAHGYSFHGIAMSTAANGQRARVETGSEAMRLLLATAGLTPESAGFRGYPFVVLYDPSGAKPLQVIDNDEALILEHLKNYAGN